MVPDEAATRTAQAPVHRKESSLCVCIWYGHGVNLNNLVECGPAAAFPCSGMLAGLPRCLPPCSDIHGHDDEYCLLGGMILCEQQNLSSLLLAPYVERDFEIAYLMLKLSNSTRAFSWSRLDVALRYGDKQNFSCAIVKAA